MYDLDEILDDVRKRYYCSTKLPRPTISWSNEKWTAIYGEYVLYNNHITISKVLNDPGLSYEALASVIYHETVHQDFGEHDDKFESKINEYPNYSDCNIELTEFMNRYTEVVEYEEMRGDFSANKESVCYIVLPYGEDFTNAFTFYNQRIFVDFNITNCEVISAKSDEYLFIFLVEYNDQYHIVGWTNKGTMYPAKHKIKHKRFGGLDVQYQLSSKRNDMYILFDSTCGYSIPKNEFHTSLDEHKYVVLDLLNEGVKEDVKYLNSYCEGFYGLGIDDAVIDKVPPFKKLNYLTLHKMAKEEMGFRGVWIANALCEIERNCETIFNKIDIKRYTTLMDSAYKDMRDGLEYCIDNTQYVIELIKLCAIVNDFKLGRELIEKIDAEKYATKDKCLKESVKYLTP